MPKFSLYTNYAPAAVARSHVHLHKRHQVQVFDNCNLACGLLTQSYPIHVAFNSDASYSLEFCLPQKGIVMSAPLSDVLEDATSGHLVKSHSSAVSLCLNLLTDPLLLLILTDRCQINQADFQDQPNGRRRLVYRRVCHTDLASDDRAFLSGHPKSCLPKVVLITAWHAQVHRDGLWSRLGDQILG